MIRSPGTLCMCTTLLWQQTVILQGSLKSRSYRVCTGGSFCKLSFLQVVTKLLLHCINPPITKLTTRALIQSEVSQNKLIYSWPLSCPFWLQREPTTLFRICCAFIKSFNFIAANLSCGLVKWRLVKHEKATVKYYPYTCLLLRSLFTTGRNAGRNAVQPVLL